MRVTKRVVQRALGAARLASVLIAVACAGIGSQPAKAAWFDKSHDIFFPPQFRDKIAVQQEFPVFWWNFMVIEPGPDGPNWPMLHRLCKRLKEQVPALLSSAECDQGLKDFGPFVRDWARDLPLRETRPGDRQIIESLNSALAQASLPTGDSGLLPILRVDPLGSWRNLKDLAEKKSPIHMERVSGFFLDQDTKRVIIPWQAAFLPGNTATMRKLREVIQKEVQAECGDTPECGRWTLVGPHPAPLQNEEQVTQDSSRVSLVGALILLLGGIALALSGRGRLFWLVPPVLAAVGLAALITIAVFGSIHGLTLSFGTAIIGLALDYGINGALNASNRRIWRTNVVGLMTTLAGLVVLMGSSIPLLRQMMFFATSGLLVAFAGYYVLITRYPQFFGIKMIFEAPRPGPLKKVAVGALLVCSLAGGAWLRPDLNMSQFDFRDTASRESMIWLFKRLNLRSPLFLVHDESDALDKARKEKQWSASQGVPVENVANYLPTAQEQAAHLRSWQNSDCETFKKSLSSSQVGFFRPFLETQACSRENRTSLPEAAYLNHLRSGTQWITLFLPENDAQESKVRARYPDALSMREVVSSFPNILQEELTWMAPLSFLIVLLLHFAYYRNVRYSLLAVLPFFTGMGTVTVAIWLFGYPFSFVSVMAAVIVFGFSLDYGIFATDACRQSRDPNGARGVWTAVPLSAFATLSGFAPLLFCRHPVLKHLGQTLFFGGLGTYVGAVWGIPWLAPLIEKGNRTAPGRWSLLLMRLGRGAALAALLMITWVLHSYHLSVFVPPKDARDHEDPSKAAARVAQWMDKSELGIHQLVLTGEPLERGLAEGWVTRNLIYLQESELITQLNHIVPPWIRRPLEPLVFRWFWGMDGFFEPWMTREMYGVSESTTHEYDYLGDRYTRQVQYHGLHEVGQLMIDQVGDDMGCTVVAIPDHGRWVIGRNFDFEGGRVFDTEKVMKWVFPERGNAFVSVIWSGMVGAVTAVNDKGVYISLNAAGSTDFRRFGVPSTLVLLKALQFGNTAEEAVEIIRKEKMFITDIFVVSDSREGKLFRVEKSPQATEVIALSGPSVVTNHLVSPRWQNDRINVFRRDELTSQMRAERGTRLAQALWESKPEDLSAGVLAILRDKGESDGKPLHLGNRRAIDALIAAHAVIYDQPANTLFVSKGPGVSGEFVGFDLAASFASKKPVVTRLLPRDFGVSDSVFDQVRASAKLAKESERFSGKKKCSEAGEKLARSAEAFGNAYWYFAALGDFESRCKGDKIAASRDWRKALSLAPAYPREVRALEERLK